MRNVRGSEPHINADGKPDEDCWHIAKYLWDMQWGRTTVILEWSEKRQVLEATVFHKLPIWRYNFSNFSRGGHWTGYGYGNKEAEDEKWAEFGVSLPWRADKLYRPEKGNWIRGCRADFEVTDANFPKELLAVDIETQMKHEYDTYKQFVGEWNWGPIDPPYPAPKGSVVDWEWRDDAGSS